MTKTIYPDVSDPIASYSLFEPNSRTLAEYGVRLEKAILRDNNSKSVEDNRAAKRQRYQEDVEENRAAKRQKYEDNSAAIKASERNRYWNDPAVRLAKRAAERKRYRRGSPNYHYHPKQQQRCPHHQQQQQQRCPHHQQQQQQRCPHHQQQQQQQRCPHRQQQEHRYSIGTSAPTTTSPAATLALPPPTRMAPMA
eukprot:Em0011g1004a